MLRDTRPSKARLQEFVDMFVWTSGFQKSLAHTDFNMFVDEGTSANESSVQCISVGNKADGYSMKVNIRDVC